MLFFSVVFVAIGSYDKNKNISYIYVLNSGQSVQNLKNKSPCAFEKPSPFQLFLAVFGSVMRPSMGPGQLSQQY